MAQPDHPYRKQADKAFWKRTVQDVYPLDIADWYTKKFAIGRAPVATAGSCFAQHIGRELRAKGFNYVDVEPPPPLLPEAAHQEFGYGMYSARYGNIYTPRQLLQLAQRALGEFTPVDRAWAKDGGYVDPFRPAIEPKPLASIEEVEISRKHHLATVAGMFEKAGLFVFTFGLTEAWISARDGAVFPLAPGVAGGEYRADECKFVNFTYNDALADMQKFIRTMRGTNSKMRFLLTVSPVPLMATATANQVVVATTYSKAVLRAVAGRLAETMPFVDYFPSFEIISSPVMGGYFYGPDKRGVSRHGVEHVMRQFFREHVPPAQKLPQEKPLAAAPDDDEVQCEEELLRIFGEDAAG